MSDSGDREQLRLQQARALDREALAAIYDEYHPAMYRYIYRRVGDRETARDLAADVFHRLLKAIQRGGGPDKHLSAWLYRTAHNAVVDHYRRQQHRQHLPLDEEIKSGAEDLEADLEGRLTAIQLRQAMSQLTPDQQQVISLKFLEGMSNQEVADMLDKPVGAVKSLQHRALAALRRCLGSDRMEDGS